MDKNGTLIMTFSPQSADRIEKLTVKLGYASVEEMVKEAIVILECIESSMAEGLGEFTLDLSSIDTDPLL